MNEAVIEQIAQRTAELLRDSGAIVTAELMDAQTVADWLSVDRSFVYEHADELGAKRLPGGDGERGRLRFDPAEINARIAAQIQPEPAEPKRPAPQKPRGAPGSGLLPIRG